MGVLFIVLLGISWSSNVNAEEPPPSPPSIVTPAFSITKGHAGRIELGMSSKEVDHIVPINRTKSKEYISQGDRYRDLEIYASPAKTGTPLLVVTFGEWQNWKAVGITVFDPRYTTEKGIGPGATLSMVKKAYPLMPVAWGDDDVYGVSLLDTKVIINLDVRKPVPNLNLETFKGRRVNGLPAVQDFDLISDTTTVKSVNVY